MVVETEVLIVGAGPTGLMLGCELRRRHIDCIVVDRAERIDRRTRAVMVHAASLEQLEGLGLRTETERRAVRQHRIAFHTRHGTRYHLDFDQLDTRHPYFLNIPQPEVEAVLAAEYQELGGTLVRALAYRSHQQTPGSVRSVLDSATGPLRIDSRFLVGADGASSTVRESLAVAFPGTTYPMSYLLAEGTPEVSPDPDESAMYIGEGGAVSLLPLPDGTIRVAGPAAARLLDKDAALTHQAFQDTVDQLGFGPRLRLARPERVAQYQVHERIAQTFRVGRVLLAGDAAHLNSPAGGQAMNTGFGDAAALSWRLAQALRPTTGFGADGSGGDEDLLDGYARERPAAARAVARSTGVLNVLQSMREAVTDAQQDAVRAALTGLAETWSQLYLTYPQATAIADGSESADGEVLPFDGTHRLRAGARVPGPGPVPGRHTLLMRPGHVPDACDRATALPVATHADELTARQARWLPADAVAVLVRPDRHIAHVLRTPATAADAARSATSQEAPAWAR
ncbi:FAD-dependent monooxygenase [Kitasatospora mediocidica]|uniref:FAD-dependent monooxygenase n=1 Tax=Kitasatospora mediocidica TaxID=58352 RepID=UPI00056D0816|nr:FAD-dependent monooxygenase [Kitasatospora mediocidica]